MHNCNVGCPDSATAFAVSIREAMQRARPGFELLIMAQKEQRLLILVIGLPLGSVTRARKACDFTYLLHVYAVIPLLPKVPYNPGAKVPFSSACPPKNVIFADLSIVLMDFFISLPSSAAPHFAAM
jgi:hypothetical protein